MTNAKYFNFKTIVLNLLDHKDIMTQKDNAKLSKKKKKKSGRGFNKYNKHLSAI